MTRVRKRKTQKREFYFRVDVLLCSSSAADKCYFRAATDTMFKVTMY